MKQRKSKAEVRSMTQIRVHFSIRVIFVVIMIIVIIVMIISAISDTCTPPPAVIRNRGDKKSSTQNIGKQWKQ